LDRALASGAKDEKSQPPQKQQLNENANSHSSVCSTFSVQKTIENHPELEQIITAWPQLPEHIKTAVKALIDTYKMKE